VLATLTEVPAVRHPRRAIEAETLAAS